MSENIYAYTEPSAAPYPAYVSINKTPEGVSISVRSAGDELASEMVLPPSVYTNLVDALLDDTMIEIAIAQLKELAKAVQGFADAFKVSREVSPFIFELGDEVKLMVSDERGTIVARAQQPNMTSYLVHYKAATGCATSGWFDEGYLQLDCAEDCVLCGADLPTDAEIPMGPEIVGFDPAPAGDATVEWKNMDGWTPAQPTEAAQ